MRLLVIEHATGRADGMDTVIVANHGAAHVWRPYQDDEEPSLSKFDGVIIGGGPMGTDQLDQYPFFKRELGLIERALSSMPVLGICLGAQLLALMGGGEVKRTFWRRGWLRIALVAAGMQDPLFRDCDDSFTTFEYHQDEIARLPGGASLLATSDNCSVEAFRFDSLPVWGIQAHPEITLEKAQLILPLMQPESQDERGRPLDPGIAVRSSSNEILLNNFCRLTRSIPLIV